MLSIIRVITNAFPARYFMGMRTLIRLFSIILIAGGFGLVLYAGYIYLGADLAYAIERIAPGGADLTNIATTAPSTEASLPYPRGTGRPGIRLVIPRMKMDAAIQEAQWKTASHTGTLYSDWNLPYDAAGHLAPTAQPGEAGNVVISGHNNLVGPNQFGVGLFAGLWDLVQGDSIYIQNTEGRIFEYRVTKSYSLKEEGQPVAVRVQHAQGVLQDSGRPMATLITCWNGTIAPLSGNTYRWIVQADLVGLVESGEIP